jgi:transcriptional regulator with XRE-family HTH domain
MSTADVMTRQNGAAIRALRRKDGQSVSDLAEACGLTNAQSLVNIENEFRQASIELLNRIARALGVPVAAILRDPNGNGSEGSKSEADAA